MKTIVLLGLLPLMALSALSENAREAVKASGPWEMAQATAPTAWMTAKVPGTVLGTLVAHGVVPDPFWGTNNRWEDGIIPDLNTHRDFYTVTYRTKVALPQSFAGKTVWMRPEGINYRSEIYLNGRLATSTRGMFARNVVEVSDFVKPGATNELVVKVWPLDHPGTPKAKTWGAANGEWHNGGDGEIGRNVTMLMSAGWDFTFADGIRDRNTGIWKDITFFATGDVRLDAPYVRTQLNADRTRAELTLELDVHNGAFKLGLAKKRGKIVAAVEGTDVRFEAPVELYRGELRTVFLKAALDRPKLWWPRNYGPQNLYRLKAKFVDEQGGVSDEVSVRFGIREVTSDQSGKDGARQFYVNGRKVFIRGTNWIPDAMLTGGDARMERSLRLLYESGVNLVRLWGGGITESDRFYELCDEYGLLVWQEFWMTGDTRHPDDPGLYLDCVAQQVKRIRSHASLAHYVASNESTETTGTEELVKRLTGTTSWMQQSECDGVHDGSPYVSVNPMRHYEDTASDRGRRICGFNPEYGAIGLPSAAMLRKMMPAADLWPVNVAAWKYREGGGFNGMTTTHHALVEAYGKSATIEDYAKKSQAADYLQERAIWECWNRARNEATGILYWYDNPPIPELVIHCWDYELNQTPMFYARRKALKPQHVQYEYLSNVVSVCSDLAEDAAVTVRAEVYDFDSRRIWTKTASAVCAAYASRDVFAIPATAFPTDRPHFIRVAMLKDGDEIDASVYWRSTDRYAGPKTMTGPATAGFAALADLPKTRLACERTATGVKVSNVGSALAFMVELEIAKTSGRDAQGAMNKAQVFFDDNYFILMPGETREVPIDGLSADNRIVAVAWNGAGECPTIVEKGRCDWRIVYGGGERDKLAAEDLQEIFEKATGVKLPLVDAASSPRQDGQLQLEEGRGQRSRSTKECKRFFVGAEFADRPLANEQTLVTARGGSLILAGGGVAGTCYAVYDFCEKYFGYRLFGWYDGCEIVRPVKDLVWDGRDISTRPAFTGYRIWLNRPDPLENEKKFFRRNRCNGGDTPLTRRVMGAQHGMELWLPPFDGGSWLDRSWKGMFKEHPEYFSLGKDGKRLSNSQACLSNPEVRKLIIARFREYAAKHGAGIYMVGSNDHHNDRYCWCDGCGRLIEKYATNGGPLWDFILELCANVRDLKDVYVTSLAYKGPGQTELAPKNIRFPENFICDAAILGGEHAGAPQGDRPPSRLSPMTLSDGRVYRPFDNLKDWRRIVDHLSYWYYGGAAPIQVYRRAQIELKEIHAAGVESVGACGTGGNPEFMDVATYVYFQLLVNPDFDADAAVRDIFRFRYGPAADLVFDYLCELEHVHLDRWNDPKWGFTCDDMYERIPLEGRDLVRWQRMFDEAAKLVADDPKRAANLALARLGLDAWTITYAARVRAADPTYPLDVKAVLKRAFAACDEIDRRGITRHPSRNNARRSLDSLQFYANLKSEALPPELAKEDTRQVRLYLPDKLLLKYRKGNHLADDPLAAAGVAMAAGPVDFTKKIKVALFDADTREWLVNAPRIDGPRVPTDAYAVFSVGTMRLPKNGFFVLADKWGSTLDMRSLGRFYDPTHHERRFEFFVSVRRAGDELYCDRVYLVERGNSQ